MSSAPCWRSWKPNKLKNCFLLCPIWGIRGWVPFGVKSILRWVPFWVQSIRGWVPFGVESILCWVPILLFFNCLIALELFWSALTVTVWSLFPGTVEHCYLEIFDHLEISQHWLPGIWPDSWWCWRAACLPSPCRPCPTPSPCRRPAEWSNLKKHVQWMLVADVDCLVLVGASHAHVAQVQYGRGPQILQGVPPLQL